ncbi:sigma-70 family RNA polymerase sigma factor [uncultured Cetobacterium sp.]|uniref:sigma-70 family RNA polymerase sigma factor n=1 Tax=uncultured Cetobacterium sp. TaxID=527638 RepID=UPI00262D8141|nr:sigma-70 family RNA polymerase sigma factor [uncultured Cetobacterium sp.]
MIQKEDIILAQQGSEDSIEKIIRMYQKVIYRNNQKFFLKGGDRDDLMQEGIIGLMKAIKSYDENRNACFSTFANLCIRRQIITAVKNYNSDKYKFLNQATQGDSSTILEETSVYSKPSLTFNSPEDIFLGKELIKYLGAFLKGNLSDLEKIVFSYLCKQYTYIEIAHILNESPKKIDNTIQRVKKKIVMYLETYRMTQ